MYSNNLFNRVWSISFSLYATYIQTFMLCNFMSSFDYPRINMFRSNAQICTYLRTRRRATQPHSDDAIGFEITVDPASQCDAIGFEITVDPASQ